MSAAPGFQHDCFLSYRHVDDVGADGRPGGGWVTRFHEALSGRLGEYLGRPAKVWRDPRLAGNDVFGAEIDDSVAASAVLVPIVTPGYRQSDWCAREFARFREQAERERRWTVGNKLAVMKVVRTPLDGDEHQTFPVDTLGYWFFETDRATDRPVRWDPGTAPYIKRLEEFAQDLAGFLARLSSARAASLEPPPVEAFAKKTLLALDVTGLEGRSPVLVVSLVAADQPDELSARLARAKDTIGLDPAAAVDRAAIDRLTRNGLDYGDDAEWLRDRVATELATLPWDGYVSFAAAARAGTGGQEDVVLRLVRGVLFDRIRGLIDTDVEVVLSARLAPFWQGISEAASVYRREIAAMDAVRVVGASSVRGGGRRDAAVEIAGYLGAITAARLADPSSSAAYRFARVYPNKLRLLHDVATGAHYSRRRPLPAGWRVS
ncbi:MAG: hypothetical protein AB7O28_20170 [Vicinamibacterales bacterium]